MRGLIYKDISIFFKSIDKKLILIAAAAIVLLIFNAGIYAGLFASVMFAMTIGMQNIMSFAKPKVQNTQRCVVENIRVSSVLTAIARVQTDVWNRTRMLPRMCR